MEHSTSNLGETIKKKLSISDLADAFGISRPTLYRYIEYYESERRDSIPEHIAMYFDYISAKDVDGNDARVRLVSMRKDSNAHLANNSKRPIATYRPAPPAASNEWRDGDIKTVSVTKDGKTMVVFEGGFDPRYNLILSMKVSGELYPIGEYKHKESKGFFIIDDIVPCKDLFYEVSYYDGVERKSSGHHPLGGDLR